MVTNRAVHWLIESRGRESHWLWKWKFRTSDRHVHFDPDKFGWPWMPETASWVVPTAYSLLALKHARGISQRDLVQLRIRRGVEMLCDRICPGGGWNAGNGVVYGFPLAPHADTTALALRPASIPTFVQWRHSTLNWKLHGDVSCAVVAKAVEKFIDFQALVYWLRPLFQVSMIELPCQVTLELKQASPSLLEFVSREALAVYGEKSRSWQLLFNWGKDHVLSQAKEEGWLDCILRQAGIHPRHVRLVDYARLWCKSRADNLTSPHPPFSEWRRDAESYVRTSRK